MKPTTRQASKTLFLSSRRSRLRNYIQPIWIAIDAWMLMILLGKPSVQRAPKCNVNTPSPSPSPPCCPWYLRAKHAFVSVHRTTRCWKAPLIKYPKAEYKSLSSISIPNLRHRSFSFTRKNDHSFLLNIIKLLTQQLIHGEHLDLLHLEYQLHLLIAHDLSLVGWVLEVVPFDVFPQLFNDLRTGELFGVSLKTKWGSIWWRAQGEEGQNLLLFHPPNQRAVLRGDISSGNRCC